MMHTFQRGRASSWLKFLALAILLAALGRAAEAAPLDREAAKQLLTLIDQRLAIAPQVAQAKWNSGGAIDDFAREKTILDTVSNQAEVAGLNPAFARRFFQAQFDAGKMTQRDLHRQWQASAQGKFSGAPDLARDVRPALDRLSAQLIAALREVYPQLHQSDTDDFIQEQGKQLIRGDVNGAARAEALRPLLDAP